MNETGFDPTGAIAILNVGSFKTWSRNITHFDSVNNSFSYDQVSNWKTKHHYYFLEGKLDLIDSPGEWFFDNENDKLYFMPPEGVNPSVENIRAKTEAYGFSFYDSDRITLENIDFFEGKGVEYMIKDPEIYREKRVVIAGGGDSALDWSIFLANINTDVTLVHRRNEFRGALDSVEKARELKNQNKIRIITPAEIIKLNGESNLESVTISHNGNEEIINVDHFIPLFGLSPKLGPIANWGLEIEKNAIKVDTYDYQTNIPGIFAIGDVNTYPGKLKLILCGFHEATLMCQSAYKIINPGKKYVLKYTTVSGIDGFDGSRKEAPKAVVQAINE